MSDCFEQQTKKGKAKKSRSSNDSFIDRLLQDTFSDDDNYLPAQKPATTTSKNAQQYLEELDEEFSGKRRKKDSILSSKKQTWVNDLEMDQFIVYFHCPVCLLPGHLSRSGTGVDIDHIKGCALSHGLHHRELISRLQSCPQKLERRKAVNKKKKIKKESKVEQQKKLSSQEVDEKMKVCKLMIIKHLGQDDDDDDEEIAKKKVHCQEHLQKRVAISVHFEKLVSLPTEEEKKEAKEKAIKNRKPGQSSPKNFTKSYLDRPANDYYMTGFKKYFKFDDD